MSFNKMFDHLDQAIGRTVEAVSNAATNACDSVDALIEGDVGKATSKAGQAAGDLVTGGLGAATEGVKTVNNLRRGVLGEVETFAREIYDPFGDVVVLVAEITGGASDE